MNIVIVNCFDTYEHRVELLYRFFSSRGDDVKVYTSNFRHFEKNFRNDSKKGFSYVPTIPYYKNFSIKRLLSHYRLSKNVFKILSKKNIELLWVLIPPNSFVMDAVKYKKKHPETKLILDIIDMWPETMPVNKIEKFFPIIVWKKFRDNWIDEADYVVTECDLYQKKLLNLVSENKMTTLYLARETKTYVENLELPEDRISLCYLGSINNIIDISLIARIISDLKKIKPIEIHIIGDGEKKEEFIQQSIKAGAEIIDHGKIYDSSEKQKIFDRCHYGLNIMKDSVFVGLTMKSLDYFEAGLPIINNIKGDTWDFVNKYCIGINVNKKIDKFDYDMKMREHTRVLFNENFTFEVFKKKLEQIVLECKL